MQELTGEVRNLSDADIAAMDPAEKKRWKKIPSKHQAAAKVCIDKKHFAEQWNFY